jgi:hypothetical protein
VTKEAKRIINDLYKQATSLERGSPCSVHIRRYTAVLTDIENECERNKQLKSEHPKYHKQVLARLAEIRTAFINLANALEEDEGDIK